MSSSANEAEELMPFAFGGDQASNFTFSSGKCYQVDVDGDLVLAVSIGKGRKNNDTSWKNSHEIYDLKFRVDSRLVARASPVFKRVLMGGFAPLMKPSTGQWAVDLPDDDPVAMGIILNVIHSQHQFVPLDPFGPFMDITDLYNIAVLSDRYSFIHQLRPYAAGWMKLVRERYFKIFEGNREFDMLESESLRVLWISWVFGDHNMFRFMTCQVAPHCRYIKTFNTGGAWTCGILRPPGILVLIRAVIDAQYDALEELLQPMTNPNLHKGDVHKDMQYFTCLRNTSTHDSWLCRSALLGSMMLASSTYPSIAWFLSRQDGENTHCPRRIALDIEQATKRVDTIDSHICDCGVKGPRREGFLAALDSCLRQKVVLSEEQQKHLSTEAKKSGLHQYAELHSHSVAVQQWITRWNLMGNESS